MRGGERQKGVRGKKRGEGRARKRAGEECREVRIEGGVADRHLCILKFDDGASAFNVDDHELSGAEEEDTAQECESG